MDLLIKNIAYVFMTYALTYLFVAASIFNTRDLKLAQAQSIEPGFIPIRPFLQKFRFFRSLMSCYFCSGIWCGPPAYLVYWVWSGSPLSLTTIADAIAHILSGATLVWVLQKKIEIMDSLSQNSYSMQVEEIDEKANSGVVVGERY